MPSCRRTPRTLPAVVLLPVVALGAVANASTQPTISIGTPRFGNVFYAGEAKQLLVGVDWPPSREPEAVALALDVRGPFGESVLSEAVPLVPTPGERTGVRRDLGATANGFLQAEAVLRSAAGDELARSTTTLGVVPPLPEQDARRSAIGYYFDPRPNELPLADLVAAQAASLGIRWAKLHFRWDDNRHARPDVLDPSWLDTSGFEAWVDAFRRQGIRVLGQITQVARWASSRPDEDGPNHHGRGPIYALVAPREMGDWALMVRTVITRLRGRVDAWEIGNEPEGLIYFMGSVEEFSDMVLAAHEALQEVDPQVPLVVNMVNTWDKVWAREMLDRVGSVLDVFGFHYASRSTVDWVRDDLLGKRQLRAAIWNTEAYGNTEADGSDRMFTHWFDERAAGTSRLFHFVYHLPFFSDPQAELARFATFGKFLVNPDYTPRVHALALRTLSDLVGTKEYVSDFCVTHLLWGYAFRDGKQAVLALVRPGADAWVPEEALRASVRFPRRTREVVVTDLMGNRQTVSMSRRRYADIPVTGAVTFVEGIPLKRVRALRFRGYVGPDGRMLAKGRKRRAQYCDAWQLGVLPSR